MVDASQEMVALGVCNLMGSFVSSMPTTGSFSRTAVNSSRCRPIKYFFANQQIFLAASRLPWAGSTPGPWCCSASPS